MLKNIKRQALLTTLLILLPLKCFASLLYWNLFNIEGESSQSSVYVTYAAFEDMLNDENRLGTFLPDAFGASQNVVGSGAFVLSDSAVVPEPGVFWLMLSGLAGIMLVTTRKPLTPRFLQ